jgi:transcription elongation factor Elf1
MKTTTYRTTNGEQVSVEYDETAPCLRCGEPVVSASMGGTDICGWCDMGHCRYCGVSCGMLFKESIDGGASLRRWREHMAWHRRQRPASSPEQP